ncbi:interferon-induced very large GTPase 1-like [Engraulis encrasicolus]|uniref:interferon-induced very large GTPase 1-like n=1 Tax=Engraulis encrasicolus TaxID=184585 RepID=UPI002FD6539B
MARSVITLVTSPAGRLFTCSRKFQVHLDIYGRSQSMTMQFPPRAEWDVSYAAAAAAAAGESQHPEKKKKKKKKKKRAPPLEDPMEQDTAAAEPQAGKGIQLPGKEVQLPGKGFEGPEEEVQRHTGAPDIKAAAAAEPQPAIWVQITGKGVEQPGEEAHLHTGATDMMERRPPSPVFSMFSMKSDVSMDLPLHFRRTCITPHYTDPQLEKHQLQDIQHQDVQLLCTEHQRQLEFFCSNDQTAICSRCLLHQHKGHDAIEQVAKSSISTKGDVLPPGQLQFTKVSPDSVALRWSPPEGATGPHRYTVTWRQGAEQWTFTSPSCQAVSDCQVEVTGLRPGLKYHFSVATLSQDGCQSTPMDGFIHTGLALSDLLSALGLRDLQGGKLTLSSVLEINSNTLSDTPPQGLQQLPWTFLRKLMMSNLNARNVQCDQPMYRSSFTHDTEYSDVNPLDLITALFHCADPFLQQEMVVKMSLCQFAVPLLLPNCDTQQSTLMLWAMRDLVKNYRGLSSSSDGTFVEGRIVEMEIPMVSFVRVGESSLSKSQTLNSLMSNLSQPNKPFTHHNMPCGNVPRKISEGLVEVSWYLPCGNKNIDIFTQPVAMANLRGDSRSFEAQVSFLCQTSAAVFIFSDDLEVDFSPFTNLQAELFLVSNSQNKNYNVEKLKEECRKYNRNNHKNNRITEIIKKNQNKHEFVNMLRFYVKGIVENKCVKTNMFNLEDVARDCDIFVDHDFSGCRNGKRRAEEISGMVKNVVSFKEKHLPLHGTIWKEISQLEKETCRMRNANKETGIEVYRSSLNTKELELREKQQRYDLSHAMAKFIAGISVQNTERLYFLKWLKIKLDTLTKHDLSSLRQQYKDSCSKNPQDKEKMKNLDEQISNCSLGPEHFFRELGQIYECACSRPEDDPARHQVQHLPSLCAQMLLDGFPVELVDGDASNIPMKWISAVLTQLHRLVNNKSRILVLTILGVQSTGKSTLLNTMFGVQFAVSSGRCTRGAFMLLIKVSEELKSELKCDFIMVIDTEGLKSPELAALDTSYEHDNELATLVIGLSDITIINVAMENTTEMKDVLQIAVHAFLRMSDFGKKPKCLFVHQNVSDMSAHDKTMRDRNKLVEQLNEMTQAAAKMERREANTKFTDVMKYDPDKDSYYIPGLWHGTPPMAPVNTGYSEAVYELKKCLIHHLKSDYVKSSNATQFLRRTQDLWSSVKFENFIFNFRNSLEADAYLDLCTHYNNWEWTFKSEMNSWLIAKTRKISNFGLTEKNVHISELNTVLSNMMEEAQTKLHEEEKKIQDSIQHYFKQKNNKVDLVEKYRQDFQNSASSLRQQTDYSLRQRLEQAIEIKMGMEQVSAIKDKQTETIERKVLDMLKQCREGGADLSEDALNREFDNMWKEILSKVSNVKLQQTDVYQNASYILKENLSVKGGHIIKMFDEVDLKTIAQKQFSVKKDWFSTWKDLLTHRWTKDTGILLTEKQELCNHIIEECHTLVNDHICSMKLNNTDYSDTYIHDLLNHIDGKLKHISISDEGQANLKFYIIGYAANEFQKAHNEFRSHNDPQETLKRCKNTFLDNFLASFNEKVSVNQCLKKAQQFAETCVRPAVEIYVSQHLSQAIANEMKTEVNYNTRINFQFAVLKQLLEEHSFEKYKKYTRSYEPFVKDWIKQQIIKRLSTGGQLARLEKQLLSDIVKKINHAITNSTRRKIIKGFIQQFCSALQDQLVIPSDALDNFPILLSVDTDQFIFYLKDFIKDMEESLAGEYGWRTVTYHITERIEQLPSKPHDLLFSSVCGCGQQCPFCDMPCETGGQGHKIHAASMHRPEAFAGCYWPSTKKLQTDICTTAVISDGTFRSSATRGEWHPYKKYREIYPDWDIAGNTSVESSDYWKYVMMKFNEELAEYYKVKPVHIPYGWSRLTKQDALTSLKRSFNMGHW